MKRREGGKKPIVSVDTITILLGKDHVEVACFLFVYFSCAFAFLFLVINRSMSVLQILLDNTKSCVISHDCNVTLPILDVNCLSVYIL